METNPQLPARLNLGALLLGSGAAWVVALRGGSAAGAATALLLASGAWVAALSAGQLALRAREARERDELGELNRRGREGALFEAKPESLHAAQARAQFDRVLVPAFTVLLLAAQGAAGWWFWRRWEKFSAPAEPATWLMVVFSLLALLCFVLGKYSASLARQEPARLLRPGASHLLWKK